MRRVVCVVVTVAGLSGCDDEQPAPAEAPARLASVTRACVDAARPSALVVRCPAWLPPGRWGARQLDSARCEYLIDVNGGSSRGAFHALAGGRCGTFTLRTRNGGWPARPRRVRDLRLIGSDPLEPGERGDGFDPVRLRLLRRTRVGEHAALLLVAAPFPRGGVHGGHIAAVWNQDGSGYALTLHFADEGAPDRSRQRTVLRAATSMSRSGLDG